MYWQSSRKNEFRSWGWEWLSHTGNTRMLQMIGSNVTRIDFDHGQLIRKLRSDFNMTGPSYSYRILCLLYRPVSEECNFPERA